MIQVLRIGHRLGRDARISTHVGLVARALGADKIVFSGDRDKKMMNSIREVKKEWGGGFQVEYKKNWKRVVKDFKGKVAHLTMYGMPVEEKIEETKKEKDLLVVVGGKKVPGELYGLVNWNIAVTNQPHSEVAALGVFLDRYFEGKELKKNFEGGRLEVEPQEKGKKVIEKSS